MNEEEAHKLKPFDFQRLFGVLPETYKKMVSFLETIRSPLYLAVVYGTISVMG